ncbi:MAG: cytochrome P450, partial [Pseudomonadota bacterium]|nr:cytochrome P450 [Pseudomonadota bacterium]
MTKRCNRAVSEFSEYLADLIDDPRHNPSHYADDVMGRLIDGSVDGNRLSDLALIQNCISILNAGHETTTKLICNGVAALFEHPAQLARLQQEPGLIDSAVEEFLRFESSNQLGNRRVAEETVVGGVAMKAGNYIHLCIGAANRDPSQFTDPKALNIERRPNRHLAFVSGTHACAGM